MRLMMSNPRVALIVVRRIRANPIFGDYCGFGFHSGVRGAPPVAGHLEKLEQASGAFFFVVASLVSCSQGRRREVSSGRFGVGGSVVRLSGKKSWR